LIEKYGKENVCIDCKHYEACGGPERFMKCLGYEEQGGVDEKKVKQIFQNESKP